MEALNDILETEYNFLGNEELRSIFKQMSGMIKNCV